MIFEGQKYIRQGSSVYNWDKEAIEYLNSCQSQYEVVYGKELLAQGHRNSERPGRHPGSGSVVEPHWSETFRPVRKLEDIPRNEWTKNDELYWETQHSLFG